MHCEASPMRHGMRMVGMVILGVFTAVIFGLIFGFVVQALWNWLMPSLFGLKTVTYWQAFGLVLLARLMVGSMGHPGKHGPDHMPKPHGHFHHEFKKEWNKEWEKECGKWGNRENWRDWRYYDEWWSQEGKESFERFVEGKKGPSEGENS